MGWELIIVVIDPEDWGDQKAKSLEGKTIIQFRDFCVFCLAFKRSWEPQKRSPVTAALKEKWDVEEALERQGKWDRAFELDSQFFIH